MRQREERYWRERNREKEIRLKEAEEKEFFPLLRPSSSTDGDTEKRYSERKVRERERETEDAIGLQGWAITL